MTLSKEDINLDKLAVLVVEADENSGRMISQSLLAHGARVETARDGAEGFEKFRQQAFPVIITGIDLPLLSGLELAEKIKGVDPQTHIIAISSNRDTDCLVAAIRLGFSNYLIKPFSTEKLLWMVNKCNHLIACRQQLEEEQGRFQAVVESIGEGITIKDLDYRIIYQNRAMTEMFGNRIGTACYTAFGFEAPCEKCPTGLALHDGQPHTTCRKYLHKGMELHIESTASLITNSRGEITGTVEIIRNINERVKNEQTIRELAFHDHLTGLANRRLFEDRLEQAIAASRRLGTRFAVMTLDLDNFKEVNDSFGHDAGDQVLREAADRIRDCCRRDLDTISRHGGDEFCIILSGASGREQLSAIAEELLLRFSRPFLVEGRQVRVTTSIGISVYPDNGTAMKELEIASDRAMYDAKKDGRNTFMFWEPHLEPRAGS